MNKKHPLLVLLAISTVLLAVLAEIVAWFVIPESVPDAARLSSPLLFIASSIVLFPVYKRLDSLLSIDVSKMSGEEEMHKGLDKAGKVPLVALCLYFVSNSAAFIIYSVAVTAVFGAGAEMTIYAIMMLALAFMGGGYLYAFSDVFISSSFKRQRFTDYPLSLRYKRQALKAILIPAVTMLMGVAVTMGGGAVHDF